MIRLIAALVVVTTAIALAGAQPAAKHPGGIQTSLDESGAAIWTLPEEGSVSLEDLIALYSRTRSVTTVLDPKRVAGSVDFHTAEGTKLAGDDIDLFVSNALADHRYCMMNAGGTQVKIVPAAEAITMAAVVTEQQLETTPDWQWITVRFEAEYSEANALRGAMQNLTTRQGGVVNPISGANILLICDRADRVKAMCATCREIDNGMKPDIRAHAVPAAIEVEAAVKGLRELFQNRRMNTATFTAGLGQHNVVVRGPASLHEEVVVALAAMK